MLNIPANLTAFLYWLKDQTETFWRQNPRVEPTNGCYQEWPAGVHWVGMTEAEIEQVEARYAVRFTPDHREFLRVLHTLNQPTTYVEEASESGLEDRTERLLFPNWLTDESEIRIRLAQPHEDLHKHWLPEWGPKPASEEERAAGFAQQFSQAPALLPLQGHRYMVSEPLQPGNPVLSMMGTDIIVYGWNLRSYLLQELREYLAVNLADPVLENGELADWEDKPEVAAIFQADQAASLILRIPFYENFIQTWNGWPPRADGQGSYGPILTA